MAWKWALKDVVKFRGNGGMEIGKIVEQVAPGQIPAGIPLVLQSARQYQSFMVESAETGKRHWMWASDLYPA